MFHDFQPLNQDVPRLPALGEYSALASVTPLIAQESSGESSGAKPSYVAEGLLVGFLAAVCLFAICKSGRRG